MILDFYDVRHIRIPYGSSPKLAPKVSWAMLVVPSGYVKIAIDNGHRNSGFTH